MSEGSLSGRVAVVTGAGAGIGETYAHALAGEGAAVVIADVDEAAARRVAADLSASGSAALAVCCDIADERAVQAAVERVIDEFGGIDIMVNNAALHLMAYSRPVTELPLEQWRRMLDVNVTGIVNWATACRPVMRERGGGVIVNQSSVAAYLANGAYAISKLAVNGLTMTLARELAGDGIRVYGIAPGPIATAAALDDFPDDLVHTFVQERQVIKRIGQPDDLVGALLFFCSDAASFVTGETLIVGGGYPVRP